MDHHTRAPTKGLREGSPLKRRAILDAARVLFVAEGFERTSVDAVALRANVSKRTVYDYYGGKSTLLVRVVEEVGQALMDSIHLAIRAHLGDEASLTGSRELEAALIAFALQVASSTIESSDYAAFVKLVSTEGSHLTEMSGHSLADAPENAIAERLAYFAREGLLEVTNANRAADHFVALSFALVINNGGVFGKPSVPDTTETITEGVRAFFRAYSAR
ncbi:TetR/AcrR family transcriptional regulator [Arthrobacter cryoconiti]|uniref:TetR/AcrR family transcriptional regulator n=1 Tax=Arthrobacter cryoconiti TaxID=748907 RepID=A0ABV8QY20_9MICC|nr:TetR/AcrR family transcriptional regulator [Arthrobacter cryoconiti]MCC9067424.1 TetR/AcrR family transcriptional regulator [Arthrobacter cryoconiti]